MAASARAGGAASVKSLGAQGVIPKIRYRLSDKITLKQRIETSGSDSIGTDRALREKSRPTVDALDFLLTKLEIRATHIPAGGIDPFGWRERGEKDEEGL